MVLQMADVIAHEIIECCGLIPRHGLPRNLIEIMSCPRPGTFVISGGLHHARDVEIEVVPQRDELAPGRIVITLHRHPRVLVVTRKLKIVPELCPNEALVIVGSRIDEMTNYLSRAPLPRRGATA